MVRRGGVHEDVRIRVVELLRGILKEVLEVEERSGKREAGILRRMIDSPDIVLLIPQELRVSGRSRKKVDAAFGDKVIFEFKSSIREFEGAKEKAEREYLGRTATGKAKYYIITNYERWEIYEVRGRKLVPLAEGSPRKVRGTIKNVVTSVLPRLYPVPENVMELFTLDVDELFGKLRGAFEKSLSLPTVRPLYEAYKEIMKMLYGEAEEGFFRDLFLKHTYLHMVVLSSLCAALGKRGDPRDMASGAPLDVEVALPYLNWWRYSSEATEAIEVAEEVTLRAGLVDWDAGPPEDVFRELYEGLIKPETRRRLGEYYTPLWLVDLGFRDLELRDKVILDPFCGSGTFLVRAFHKKVEGGEDPRRAFGELVGFDVNPLAVTVARAELILAYRRYAGRGPEEPPHVYHVDTLSLWFGEEKVSNPVKRILGGALDTLQFLLNSLPRKVGIRDALEAISYCEGELSYAIRLAHAKCGLDWSCLKEKISKQLLEKADSGLAGNLLRSLDESGLSSEIADLIVKYGGNDVWGLMTMSIYAPVLLSGIRPHVVATNPPWAPLNEYKAPYTKSMSQHLRELVLEELGLKNKIAQIMSGSDIAAAALSRILDIASEAIVFVMNRDQVFPYQNKSSGMLSTYSVIKSNNNYSFKIYISDYDAFGHGMPPALIVARRGGKGVETRILSVEGSTQKSNTLEEVEVEERESKVSYEEAINHLTDYFREDLEKLAEDLSVDKVIPMGDFIRGTFGGEGKRGSPEYAGIALTYYEDLENRIKIRLWNTRSTLEVPKEFMKEHSIKIFDMIYVSHIFPFKYIGPIKVILSENGAKDLKKFFEKIIDFNKKKIRSDDEKKIERLIIEVQQPQSLNVLESKKCYVVARTDRIFSSVVIEPSNSIHGSFPVILHDRCNALEVNEPIISYFYAAILNYLIYKAIKHRMKFNRHQYGRSFFAIKVARLSWRDVEPEVRRKVARLSLALHRKVRRLEFKSKNQKKAFKEVENISEFKELVGTLDKVVDENELLEALSYVASSSKRS